MTVRAESQAAISAQRNAAGLHDALRQGIQAGAMSIHCFLAEQDVLNSATPRFAGTYDSREKRSTSSSSH
jgi:hypothetical protein